MATTKRKTIGGKFNSIGSRQEQEANRALVTKLVGEIGSDSSSLMTVGDGYFLLDTLSKLNQPKAVFGWRQVEGIVALHRKVMEARNADAKI